MRKSVIPFLSLILCILACNLPRVIQLPAQNQIETATKVSTTTQAEAPALVETPTQVEVPTLIPTSAPAEPTATSVIISEYPVIWVPIQAIRVADDDNRRITKITSAQIADWIAKANEIYAWSGIQFSFDEKDYSLLHSTLLNNIAGVEDKNWFDEIAYAEQITSQYPDKLVLFFRWGPGDQPTGGAFSWVDYDFVAMPGFDTGVCGYQNIGILAHEIGHYLGLSHTFSGVFKDVAEAEAVLKNNGNKLSTFDGDGFSDTPPDPFIALDEYQCQPVKGVTLNGLYFPVPRENIMSYYEVRTGLSELQIERARWVLSTRMAHGMSMPKNSKAPQPLEVQDLSLLSHSGCSTIYQDMSSWGKQQWNKGDQLFVTSGKSCALIFGLPVQQAGKYRLDLYLTSAPDFGRIQVYLDGKVVGEVIDLYMPLVMPTGAISVGTFDLSAGTHQLTFLVIGTNSKSNNYSFGLDCFSLVPQ
jgi:hypothetical protein